MRAEEAQNTTIAGGYSPALNLSRLARLLYIGLMTKREYATDEEYRAAVRRDNETVKAVSSLFLQLGGGLIAGTTAAWWFQKVEPWALALWFVGAIGLIVIGLLFLKALQAES